MEAAMNHPHAEPDDQDGLFDQVVENDVLAAALERREQAKQAKNAATKAYKDAHDAAKAHIDALELEEGAVVRCGRFRLKLSAVQGRSVSFETGDTSRLSISLLDAD